MNIERLKTRKKYNQLKHQLKSNNDSGYILPKFENIDKYIIIIVVCDDVILSSLIASISDNNIMINGMYTPINYRRKGYCSMLHIWLNKNYINKYDKIVSIPIALSESKYVYEKLGYENEFINNHLVYFLHLKS